MKNYLFLLSSLFFVSLFATPAAAQSSYEGGIVLCKIPDTTDAYIDTATMRYKPFGALLKKYDVKSMYVAAPGLGPKLDRLYVLEHEDTATTAQLVVELDAMGNMEFVERLPKFELYDVPDDFDPLQYSLVKISAPQAWDVSTGSEDVVIAIVDNGIRLSHEDLTDNIWRNEGELLANGIDDDFNGYVDDVYGYDVSDDDNDPRPPSGIADTSNWVHGSHCAGIASASTNNGRGISSIGYSVKIMAVKCAPDNSNGRNLNGAFDGVIYALRAGADIISMSFGTNTNSRTIQLLMDQANEMGVVMVAAAGNDNSSEFSYPAAYDNVIAVAATDRFDKKASFSNYGSWVDVSAPGVGIKSTFAASDISYGSLSGTSMATPLVAGLAGLMISADGNASAAAIRNRLISTADNIDAVNPSFAGRLGSGRINAARALGNSVDIPEVEGAAFILHAYPNPVAAHSQLRLEWEQATQGQVALQLLAPDGRLVKSHVAPANVKSTTFQMENVPPGIYFLKANTVAGTAVVRLRIQ